MKKECDMDPGVRGWLAGRMLWPYAEVSVISGPVDMIGVSQDRCWVVAVEMKLNWRQSLARKMYENQMWANEVWFYCLRRPTKATLDMIRERGWGVMSHVHGELVPATRRSHGESNRHRIRLLEKLTRHDPALTAGVPSQKGNGPRQSCLRRITDYMSRHPLAKSREVFTNVPNHYASFASFSGVFGGLIRDLRKKREVAR